MYQIKKTTFLKDVLICTLGAYGGPEAHISIYLDQLVEKKKYLTEEELLELIALCSILPGPTSTQTIVSVGYKVGGPFLAFLTMLVWALPVLLIMSAISFLYPFIHRHNLSSDAFRLIGPMAVGLIFVAAYRMIKKVIKNKLTFILLVFSATLIYFIHTPWLFPFLLLFGGLMSILSTKETQLWNRINIHPPWKYLITFILLGITLMICSQFSNNMSITLFDKFYRFGYLVFGGGQVLVPVMYSDLVTSSHFMSASEFLTGYGLVQGLPGPMFSFTAYAGGLASRNSSTFLHMFNALLSGTAIFLPGLLLIYFIYPVWKEVKQIRGIKVSLLGINAVATGLISASSILMLQKSGITPIHLLVTAGTIVLVLTKKIPIPIIVLISILLGILL